MARSIPAPDAVAAHRLTRRSFFVRVGGLGVAIAFADSWQSRADTVAVDGVRIGAWVTIGTDDIVTIVSPAAEMGQGVKTSLPLLVAEEMDADWAKVRIVQAHADKANFGNPGFGGLQLTGGSQTTRGYYGKLRLVGAQARQVILAAAASAMQVPVAELRTGPNLVVHSASGRQMSYGALARVAQVPAALPAVTDADLKRPDAWRYIGRPVPRTDLPSKTDGTAKFGIDVVLPGMLYGTVQRAPVQDEQPLTVDDTAAKAMRGVLKVVRLPYGVGVIAESTWAARRGRDALKVTWTKAARARSYDSAAALADYQAIANDPARHGVDVARHGDAPAALGTAARIITATYSTDHVHHATMEPVNATARVTGGRVEIWGPVQAQSALQFAAAHAAGTTPDKVEVTTMLLGGGLGRKSETDFGVDAVLMAKEAEGRPVKVIWTREDDVRHGKYRPMTAQSVRIGLDEKGGIVGWHQRLVCESIMARYYPPQFKDWGGVDEPVVDGLHLTYAVPGLLTEYVREPRGFDVGFWRSVGAGYTKFAIEGVLDEVAAATGADPVELRRKLLAQQPRGRRVVEVAAEMADWKRARVGSALGIAYSDSFGAHCAQVAEVSLDAATGGIRVLRVWCAVDAGIAIQPDNIVAQMEGGILHGISHALYEQVNVGGGEVQEGNFDTYRVLRMSEAPEIKVQIVASTDAPGGIGEVSLPPVAPAIANAVARLTGGKRLRHLPFLPDRVKAVLAS